MKRRIAERLERALQAEGHLDGEFFALEQTGVSWRVGIHALGVLRSVQCIPDIREQREFFRETVFSIEIEVRAIPEVAGESCIRAKRGARLRD